MAKTLKQFCEQKQILVPIFEKHAPKFREYVTTDRGTFLYYKGILFGFQDRIWLVQFARNPKANIKIGIKHYPELQDSTWVTYKEIPEKIHYRILIELEKIIGRMLHFEHVEFEEKQRLAEEVEAKTEAAWLENFNE